MNRRGHKAEAAALVHPVYQAFREGFESPDLREGAQFIKLI